MNSSKLMHDERLPLYQRLRDEMVDKISRGEWHADEAIPTEQELTKSYGVAIGTVRKAVEVLVAEGMLERNQGSGTFVRRPSFDASLFRFFRHLATPGGQRIPDSRILSRVLARPPGEVADALGIKSKTDAIRVDRLRLMDSQVVLVEEIWLSKWRFSALLDIELTAFGNLLYPFYEQQCGVAIASAQETLTVMSGNEEKSKALGIEVGKPIVVIERLAFGYDRQPLEWRRSCGAADRFRYQVDIC